MFVQSQTSFDVGTRLDLHLAITARNVMHGIVGTIAYAVPSGVGIKFNEITAAADYDIQRLFEMFGPCRTDATKASAVRLSALLLSSNAATTRLVREVFDAAAVRLDTCADVLCGSARLAKKKFEAVILDWGLGCEASRLLNALRTSASNCAAVVFAITDDEGQARIARELGANFVLTTPVSPSSLSAAVQAGYGLMLRELRRYFRCPIEVPVELQQSDGTTGEAKTLNISERGLALCAPARLSAGETVFVTFSLPGVRNRIRAVGPICWADDRGKAGLQFQEMGRDARLRLQQWLAAQLEVACVPVNPSEAEKASRR